MSNLVSIICPVFNEENSIHIFTSEISKIFEPLEEEYEIIFVDDGSIDSTLNVIKQVKDHNNNVEFISLTRNFGKDAALTAGLNYAKGDAVIPMDVDLQDPPHLIPKMLELWRTGKDIVLAKRADRSKDSWIKRNSASFYYYLMDKVGDQHLHSNVGDFRLMSKAVVASINTLEERSRYMKGLLSWVGYDVAIIEFERVERHAGTTKFNYKKVICHALDGLTSFSTVPLRFWGILGFIFSSISLVYGGYIILYTLITGGDTDGYASIFVAIVFFGGIQLISIGVLGEYIGRIYMESKSRPIYLVKEKTLGRS